MSSVDQAPHTCTPGSFILMVLSFYRFSFYHTGTHSFIKQWYCVFFLNLYNLYILKVWYLSVLEKQTASLSVVSHLQSFHKSRPGCLAWRNGGRSPPAPAVLISRLERKNHWDIVSFGACLRREFWLSFVLVGHICRVMWMRDKRRSYAWLSEFLFGLEGCMALFTFFLPSW